MSKFLSILIAAVFAVSAGPVFAASNIKVAAETTGEMKTDPMKKATKTEKKKAKQAKAQGKQSDDMKKESEKK
jgi:hypothetical protein